MKTNPISTHYAVDYSKSMELFDDVIFKTNHVSFETRTEAEKFVESLFSDEDWQVSYCTLSEIHSYI